MENNNINEMLEQINLVPLEIKADIERKAYHTYLKRLDYMKTWRVKNREKYNDDMRERMRIALSDPEYRAKMNAYKKAFYYQKKYGMTEEEYKQKKKEEEAEIIKNMESQPDRSGRRKTLEQFVKVH